ncbi:hypothetical protein BBB56_00375 [Candidatus Pantoea deserta]|uniref:Uncharacterized protein n=1 Tax=Candidatus Pantoea deserta TaxID=1869313 RepID=A0A3N4P822_9GAMM|nr:hypothetical protein [Pantoea deserta]RPE04335.1 hypothetical protein BBB56_00375 [Pantoea deserta]
MKTTYKITYEHEAEGQTRAEEVLLESEGEPSQEEVHEAILQDSARHQHPGAGVEGVAGFTVISVVPTP